MNHTCAQTDCNEPATHLVVETSNLNMLFQSGAGLVCEKHAEDLEMVGGFSLELDRPKLAGKPCPFCGAKID